MGLLADLLVVFRTEGKDKLDEATADSKKGMEGVAEGADKAGDEMVATMRLASFAIDAAAARMEHFNEAARKPIEKDWKLAPPPVAGEGADAAKAAAAVAAPPQQAAQGGNPFGRLIDLLMRALDKLSGGLTGVVTKLLGFGGASHAPPKSASLPTTSAGGGEAAGAEAAGPGAMAIGVAVAAAQLAVKTMTAAFSAAANVITGLGHTLFSFIQAGIQASSVGQVLAFQWDRLTRTIAGAFGPEIQKAIGWIEQLTGDIAAVAQGEAFGRLMDQVDAVMDAMGGLIDPLVSAVEKLMDALAPLTELAGGLLVGAIHLATQALESLTSQGIRHALRITAAAIAGFTATLIGGPLAGLAAAAATYAALQAFEEANNKPSSHKGGRGALSLPVGEGGAIEGVWDRLAKASVMTGGQGKSVAQEHKEIAQKQLAEQEKTTAAVKNIQPAFSR